MTTDDDDVQYLIFSQREVSNTALALSTQRVEREREREREEYDYISIKDLGGSCGNMYH